MLSYRNCLLDIQKRFSGNILSIIYKIVQNSDIGNKIIRLHSCESKKKQIHLFVLSAKLVTELSFRKYQICTCFKKVPCPLIDIDIEIIPIKILED